MRLHRLHDFNYVIVNNTAFSMCCFVVILCSHNILCIQFHCYFIVAVTVAIFDVCRSTVCRSTVCSPEIIPLVLLSSSILSDFL
jgi:hypothetical protein